MRWFLKKGSILKIEQRDGTGEVVSDVSVPFSGRYRLSDFCHGLRLKFLPFFSGRRALEEKDLFNPQIQLEVRDTRLALSIPADWQVQSPGAVLGGASTQEGLMRAEFMWEHIPEGVSIAFSKNRSLTFKFENQNLWPYLIPSFTIFAFLTALVLHLGVASFSRKASEWAIQEALLKRQKKVEDISQMTTELKVSAPPDAAKPAAPSAPQSAQVAQAQGLLRSWGVGKPAQSADQVLKPTAFDRAFQSYGKGDQKNLRSAWMDNDNPQDEKPLNLSESQIAVALGPVESRLKECYDDVLIHDSSLEGKPELQIAFSKQGQVLGLEIHQMTAQPSSLRLLHDCFVKAFHAVKFPVVANREFSVIQTLVLSR